jgi:EmrB/QacA subfamily drug resistance transporter
VRSSRATKHPFVVLAIVLTAVFVQLLDVSIVNVAIPSIQADIGASFAEVQLVLAGYQLTFACLLITGARLGDILGRKRVFMAGMATFTVASALCGLAPDPTTLVLARILQGLGSGLMFPQVLAVIQVTIPPRDRGKAFGVFGATMGLATILGPLVGGLLISADLFGTDWRMIFLVNIPVGLVALVAALLLLPDSRSPDAPRLDIAGALLVTAGLFLLVYPLTEGRERGWPAWVWLMLGASLPLLVAFVLLQQRKTARNASPLLLMTLFHQASFRTGLVLSLVFFAGIPAFFFSFGLYLQVGLGFTALHAGLTTFPFALATGVMSSRSDTLAKRLGTDVLTVGCALLVVGMLVLIGVLHQQGTDPHSWVLGTALLISGVGFGCFLAPLTNVVMAGIRGHEAGSASGVLSTAQQVGGALGLALVGLVLFGLLGSHSTAAARGVAPSLGDPAQARQLESCVVARAKAPDPSVVPTQCAGSEAFTRAAVQARKDNFLYTIERTLLLEVLVFGAAGLLTRALPKVSGDRLGHAPPAEA